MPIYLTGYIDDYTDRWKHYNGDVLPLGIIVQPKTFREGYLGRAGLYTWVAIDNGRFVRALRPLPPSELSRSQVIGRVARLQGRGGYVALCHALPSCQGMPPGRSVSRRDSGTTTAMSRSTAGKRGTGTARIADN